MFWIILSAAVTTATAVNVLTVKPFDDRTYKSGRHTAMRTPAHHPARAGRVPPVLPTETPVVLEENVMEGLPVSVVTVANRRLGDRVSVNNDR